MLAAHKVLPMRLNMVWSTWNTDEMLNMDRLEKAWKEGVYDAERTAGGGQMSAKINIR